MSLDDPNHAYNCVGGPDRQKSNLKFGELAELVELRKLTPEEEKKLTAEERAEIDKENNKLRMTKVCLGPNNASLEKINSAHMSDDELEDDDVEDTGVEEDTVAGGDNESSASGKGTSPPKRKQGGNDAKRGKGADGKRQKQDKETAKPQGKKAGGRLPRIDDSSSSVSE